MHETYGRNKGRWFEWGVGWKNKEIRSEARFKFQIARRVLACILDWMGKDKFPLQKFPSPAVAAEVVATSHGGVLYLWEMTVWAHLVSVLYPSSWHVCGSH